MKQFLEDLLTVAVAVRNAIAYPFSWSVQTTVEMNPFVNSFWCAPKWTHIKGSIYMGQIGPFSISGMRFA
jgi:hypothetical protein